MGTTDTPAFTSRNVVTGMCLWEALLDLAKSTDRKAEERRLRETAAEMLGDHGSFTIRGALVDLVRRCEEGADAFSAANPDTHEQFDWDWCPRFIREAVKDGTLEAAIEGQYRP